MNKINRQTLLLISLALATHPVWAEEERPRFGGPDSVEQVIEVDRTPRGGFVETEILDPFKGWQSGLEEDHGFSFGADYSALTVHASDVLDGADDSASGGMLRLYGRWNLTGDGQSSSGALVYKIEHRHAYGDNPPSGFFLGNVGYVGLTEPPFSDQGTRWTNLYWRQSLNNGRTTLVGGFLDVTDFVDVYGLASPWLHFMNLAFSTGSGSIDLPNDASLGVAAGHLFDNNVFVIGSVVDRNGDPTEIGDGFDTFFGDNEYFSSIDIGYTSAHSRIALDNVHLTLWHADAREEAGAPSGWGANFSWSRYYNDRIMPFVRAGYTDDSGSLLEKTVSVGFGYRPDPTTQAPGDLIGVGFNWGEINENAFGPGLDDQYTLELFYRWQFTQQLAFTLDYQYLKDPALNPDESSVSVWSVRGRFAL